MAKPRAEDLVVDTAALSLVLSDELRLERAVAIPWNNHFHVAAHDGRYLKLQSNNELFGLAIVV